MAGLNIDPFCLKTIGLVSLLSTSLSASVCVRVVCVCVCVSVCVCVCVCACATCVHKRFSMQC